MKTFLRIILKPLSFVPALIVMYAIFMFSSQEGINSANLSYKVSQKIVTVSNEVFDLELTDYQIDYNTELIHPYVRKGAHITEYFILAVAVSFPLYVYGMRSLWLLLFAGAFCVGFACLDEYHQAFVAGRGPSKRDVFIDSIGIFSGIVLVQLFCFIGRMTIFRPLSKKKRRNK